MMVSESTRSGDAALLTDGVSRDEDGTVHHWQSEGLPGEVWLEWGFMWLVSVPAE